MTTINTINAELERLKCALDLCSQEYAAACLEAAQARDAYDTAWASAMLRVEEIARERRYQAPQKGFSVAEKEAIATLETAELRTQAHICEAQREALKARLRALADCLSAVQSQASNERCEVGLLNYEYTDRHADRREPYDSLSDQATRSGYE
jgi:hypothetical protein